MRLRSLVAWLPVERLRHPPPVVAVVSLTGIIGRLGPWRRGLSLNELAATLDRAFKLPHVKAVALSVNSPGGAPVQAALIVRRIRTLAAEHNVPVFAFAEDVAASGGYWLLTAGDEIYADACSIVGSIGVVTASFGFADLLRRIGVERRLYVSGSDKAALDPFRPEKPEDVAHLQEIQADIHDAFRRVVRARRQGKLKGSEEDLFSGRCWSGRAALDLGLIDGLADMRTLMRERYGEKVRLVSVGGGRRWWQRRLRLPGAGVSGIGFADRFADGRAADRGTQSVLRLLAAAEDRLWWDRYGL
jgi:signal peptide peptidase SppA